MPRYISFALTTPQVRARTKTVTRRLGWEKLKVGDILNAAEKCQGLGKGGKIKPLGRIMVMDVRQEPLRRMIDDPAYGFAETTLEGFPHGTENHLPTNFVDFFCEGHKGCTLESVVTRIRFEYIDPPAKPVHKKQVAAASVRRKPPPLQKGRKST